MCRFQNLCMNVFFFFTCEREHTVLFCRCMRVRITYACTCACLCIRARVARVCTFMPAWLLETVRVCKPLCKILVQACKCVCVCVQSRNIICNMLVIYVYVKCFLT